MMPTNVQHITPQERVSSCLDCIRRTDQFVHEHVEITATGIKVHAVAAPVLNPDGYWEVEIDGKRYGLVEIQHTQSLAASSASFPAMGTK